MLSFYVAILVQVVLESLPVSSSGHILLLEQFLNQKYSKECMYLLHIPTLIILLLFFYKPLLLCVKKYKKDKLFFIKLLCFVCCVDSITVLFFIFFNASYRNITFHSPVTLVIGLSITATLLYSLRWIPRKNDDNITYAHALVIGVAQGCALLPGISRFAAVYTTCCWMGISSLYAFYITWLVQVPLIVAAVGKTLLFKDITQEWAMIIEYKSLLVIAGASVGGYYALAQCYRLALQRRLWICFYYMIIPIVLALVYSLYTVLHTFFEIS